MRHMYGASKAVQNRGAVVAYAGQVGGTLHGTSVELVQCTSWVLPSCIFGVRCGFCFEAEMLLMSARTGCTVCICIGVQAGAGGCAACRCSRPLMPSVQADVVGTGNC